MRQRGRYHGNPGSDTASCIAAGGVIFRPNPYTGRYDSLGEWKSPGTLTLSAQVAKDFSKRVTGTLILTNLYRHCFTRGYAWEQGGDQACAYDDRRLVYLRRRVPRQRHDAGDDTTRGSRTIRSATRRPVSATRSAPCSLQLKL